jgi:preprotein translocase subunit SecF
MQKTSFHFYRRYWLYFIFSLLLLTVGAYFAYRGGLRPSIDFTGGSLLEVQFSSPTTPVTESSLADTLKVVYPDARITATAEESFLLRGKDLSAEEKSSVISFLEQSFGPLTERRFETLGPVLGRELLFKTLAGVGVVAAVITLYLMRQFKELKYGLAAVIAMFHDSLMLFAVFAILGFFVGVEIDVLFVTAILTTLSFSVHDTIVLFHRMREIKKQYPSVELADVANAAVFQTASRSVNNSLTIIITLSALTLLGGQSLQWFSVALLAGAITGTYSSPFVAVPIVLLFNSIDKKRKRRIR